MTLEASDATRPLLGALLQTGWGVAATHEHFSGKKQTSEVNYLWSTGEGVVCVCVCWVWLGGGVLDCMRAPLKASASCSTHFDEVNVIKVKAG